MKIWSRFATFFAALLIFCFASGSAMAQAPSDAADGLVGEAEVTYTTIDVPGAVATNVTGINNVGEMVGGYTSDGVNSLGFTYIGGSFSYFSYPGSSVATEVGGVNDSGIVSGTAANTRTLASVGFLYDGAKFTTIIRYPGEKDTYAQAVNNAGNVVGGDGNSGGTQCYEMIGSRFRNVTPPPGGYVNAYATGINNVGEVVGWTDASSTTSFLYKGGKFRTLIVPGAVDYTEAWGINDSGTVVGWYDSCVPFCAIHGFMLTNGKYYALNFPGASSTYPLGINNAGEVVGAYMLGGVTHGFITSPIMAADFE